MADSGLSIGTLSGRIELDDHFTATITISNEALDALEKRFGKVDSTVRKTAEGFLTAEAAMGAVREGAHLLAEGLKEVSTEGAGIADVEQNFNRITLASGELGEELLGSLKEGTHNTITDFELMKSVNDTLTAGVKITKEEYKDLATGAFALAQAKGLDVQNVFTQINDAMESGSVKTLKFLTGKIDLAKAEDDYAKKLGTTAQRLTDDEKLKAAQVAIIEHVRDATQRLGDQEDGLDEKVAQLGTTWKNFTEDLGKTVATSPVVVGAFDSIEKKISDAFGVDKDQAIKAIVADIESVVTTGVELVEIGIDIVKFMNDWKSVLEPVAVGIVAVGTAMLWTSVQVKTVETATKFFVALSPELIAVGIAAGAVYAAFEIGKWQPVSDFFEKLGLEVFSGMSEAEAEAAVQTHHLTDAAVAAASGVSSFKTAQDEVKLATIDWKKEIDTIDGAIIDWAQHLLASGVSAKSVASEYGLTDVQVRALEKSLAAQNKESADAAKRSSELTNELRLSKEEMQSFITTWQNLNSLGGTFKDVLDTINPKIVDSVKYYASLGATVEDLTKAFPGLTKAQAESAVDSVKSAQEVQKTWTEVFAIQAKMHGDNITDFIKLETAKYNITIQLLKQQGKATDEALDAEKKKFDVTIDAEIRKREEQIPTSRAFYQAQVDEAKNKLDLMLAHSEDFTDQDIRLAEHDYTEKSRLLERWAQDASDKITRQEKETADLANSWDGVGDAIEADTEKMEALNAATITAAELTKALGGTTEVTFQNFKDELKSVMGYWDNSGHFQAGNDSGSVSVDNGRGDGNSHNISVEEAAKEGYSFSEIVAALRGHPLGPHPAGPKIPGFKEGGVGDFGTGTIAMLHGKEAIIPEDKWGGGSKGHTVIVEAGALTFPFAMMRDRTMMSEFGEFVGDSLIQHLEEKGVRLGQG